LKNIRNEALFFQKQKFFRKKEQGSMVSFVGVFFVMVTTFIMIMVTIAYTRLAFFKMECDNISKKYLSYMEQDGYLTIERQLAMKTELESIWASSGATGSYIVNVLNFDGTTIVQVPYGDEVVLCCEMQFDNPMYSVASQTKYDAEHGKTFISDMLSSVIPAKMNYVINISTTAKW